jgi:predicted RNA-binding Zn-ribbon protein involved in translation (DUF1610 family)
MENKLPANVLTCAQCGGELHPDEGQVFLTCPFCSTTVYIDKARVVFHWYLVPQRVTHEQASHRAQLYEAFLVYLPFWTVWARVGAWVFGEKKVGSGDDARYEPREIRVVQDMAWNGAACDVGEFGVERVPAVERGLEPFDPETLHRAGAGDGFGRLPGN